MNIIIDSGPRTEFDGNVIKVTEAVDTVVQGDDVTVEIVVAHTPEGVIIDIVDIDSGEVIGTEADTWDGIADRILSA